MKYPVIRGSVSLSLIFLLLVAPGCSDDDPASPPDEDPNTMTISVDETSFGLGCDLGIVFTSALDGTVLDFATWTGAAELKLEMPASVGESFFVTRVDDSSFSPFALKSIPQVVAEDLTLDWKDENPPSPTEEANFQFANIPDQHRFFLGSGSWRTQGSQLPENTTVKLKSQPSEVLVVLESSTTPNSYKWVEGVMSGNTYPVDLQDMDPMQEFTIALPASAEPIQYSIDAFKEAEGDLPRRDYMLTQDVISGPVPATWQADIIEPGFDGYGTFFYKNITENFFPPFHISQYFLTKGGLPETVTFWDVSFTVTDDSIDSCQLQPSEPVQEMTLIWKAEDQNSPYWYLGVPDYNQPVALPQLPEDLVTLYPELNRDVFALWEVLASRTSDGLAADGMTSMEITERVIHPLSP